MEWDDIGVGAGGGFLSGVVATIVTALGVNRRIDKLEKSVIYKDVFEQFEKRFDSAIEQISVINDKLDKLLSRRRTDREIDI